MKEKDPKKETAIFAATIDLVAEVGLTGLKMADIAKRAKIASGTLYLYFSSKEDLLNALYRHLKLQYPFPGSPTGADEPLKLRFRQLWELSLRHQLGAFKESIFLEQFSYSPYLTQESKEVSLQTTRFLVEMLEEGKRQLLFKTLDNALLICLLTGLIKQITLHCRSQDLELSPALIDQSFALCWDALKA